MTFQATAVPAGVDLYAVDTSPKFALGQRVQGVDSTYGVAEFIYLAGVASNTANSWVTFTQDNMTAVLLAANAIGPVAVSMAAAVAGNYGWFQIYGKAIGKALAGYLDNGLVYATATAGSIDDAVVAGDRVKNALGASAVGTPSAGLAEFEIWYPFMDDATAA